MNKNIFKKIIKEEIVKILNEGLGTFSSLKELYIGIKHLYPTNPINLYPNDVFSGGGEEIEGYIGLEIDGEYHIIQYLGEGIGLIWLDMNKFNKYEFSSLERLQQILNEK